MLKPEAKTRIVGIDEESDFLLYLYYLPGNCEYASK